MLFHNSDLAVTSFVDFKLNLIILQTLMSLNYNVRTSAQAYAQKVMANVT